MPEGSEQKESPAESFLDGLGKAEDCIAMFAADGGPAVLQGLRDADGILGFWVGPLTAALDAANPHNGALTRVVSAIQVPVGLAAKHEAVHGLLVHSAVEGAAAGGYSANITLGSFFASPVQMAIVIAEFKFVYWLGQKADEKWHLIDRGSDLAIRYTHADHLNPAKYPMTTIYDYLAHNLAMPADVRWLVERGLIDQGREWPDFSQYPLYLQHQLTERVADTLGNMLHAVGAAAHEMESSIFHDVRADQGHHDVPAAHASGEAASAHDHPVHSGDHVEASGAGPAPAERPAGYIEVLAADGFLHVPYYNTPQHDSGPLQQGRAGDPDPGPQDKSGPQDKAVPAPPSVTPPVHYGPPAPDQQFHLGVGLVDDHAPAGPHSSPPADLVFLGVGLVDEHGHGGGAEANPHQAGPGAGASPASDGHPAADLPHFSAHQDTADAAYQADHGSADDQAIIHGW